MAFDFKKEYKEFYMPPKKPTIITVPPMNYIAVRQSKIREYRPQGFSKGTWGGSKGIG